ncbi:hypothetical protein [Pyrobaculum sp.]|uniref:hypothetical protein n=1 Tax=Pyrobaculum sp. TaxID=2004705 RepID=UPI003D1303CD
MKVGLRGSLAYGNKKVGIDIEFEAVGATSLVGPNLTGKSLALWCIYSSARRRFGRVIKRELPDVVCEVEPGDYYAVYVDAYRVAVQLFELAVRENIEMIRERAADIREIAEESASPEGREAAERAFRAVVELLTDIKRATYGDFDIALGLKQASGDLRVREAVSVVEEVGRAMERVREEPELRDLVDDFFPLSLYVTSDGFGWVDNKWGAEGYGLRELSTVFAPALVLAEAVYAYGLPGLTYFLVEEPETHAHPVLAFFLGRVLRRLVERSGGRFNVVAATHSLDFLLGIGPPAYVFARDAERIYVKGVWRGEGRVPGFTDAAVYRAFVEV